MTPNLFTTSGQEQSPNHSPSRWSVQFGQTVTQERRFSDEKIPSGGYRTTDYGLQDDNLHKDTEWSKGDNFTSTGTLLTNNDRTYVSFYININLYNLKLKRGINHKRPSKNLSSSAEKKKGYSEIEQRLKLTLFCKNITDQRLYHVLTRSLLIWNELSDLFPRRSFYF